MTTAKEARDKTMNKANKGKGKKEPRDEVIYKTRFTYEGFNYAEFNDNGILKFLKYKDAHAEVVDFIEVQDPEHEGKKIKVYPAPQIAQTKKDRIFQAPGQEAVKIPGRPIDYESEYQLYREIKAFIHAYVELRPEDEITLSLYIMKATLYDALKDSSFPFVHIIAPYGKGKSRLLTVLCEATPYGFYAIDIKSAPLKRVSELYQVILYVDEKGDMDNETSAMINAKYNRNSIVLNASKEIQQGFSSIIGYSIYGPMVLAGRSPFKDDAIESKSLQINMDIPLSREDVPRKIKGNVQDSFYARALEIRGKLLQFRVKWHDSINTVQASEFLKKYEDKTEARLYEVISFFEDLIEVMPELKPKIQEVLTAQIIRNIEIAKETPNGMMADTVLTFIESGESTKDYTLNGKSYQGIFLSSIYAGIGDNFSKQAGKLLSILGLKTDRPWIKFTHEGKDGKEETYKKKVSMVRIPGEKKLNELKSRYDPEFMRAILSGISLDGQTNLDDVDDVDDDQGNTPLKNNGEIDNKEAISKDGQSEKDEKTGGYSPTDRPDSPDSPASKDEPTKNRAQNEKSFLSLIFRKITTDDPKLNPDPDKYQKGFYLAIPLKEAQALKAYNFSVEVSEHEFMSMANETLKQYVRELREGDQ